MFNTKKIAKSAKEIAKSERLFTLRDANRVYVCNGFYAFYMPIDVYNMYVRPVSALYPALEDGQGSVKNSNENLSNITATPMRINTIFEHNSHYSQARVIDTQYKRIMDGKKCANVLSVNGTMIFVDERFLDSARAFREDYVNINDEYVELKNEKSDPSICPVWHCDDLFGYLVLPIRRGGEGFKVVED